MIKSNSSTLKNEDLLLTAQWRLNVDFLVAFPHWMDDRQMHGFSFDLGGQ